VALGLTLATGCASVAPVDPTESAPEASESAGEIALTFIGKVDNELTLSRADLRGMDVVETTIEHPKEGERAFEGVKVTTLLEEARPNEDATLTFTATDAYSVDVPVEDAKACTDCMVAFEDDTLRLIMPDFGSSYWVKDLISIEAK
jgi:hypothetical protein